MTISSEGAVPSPDGIQQAREALDRLAARFAGPTGTNYHLDCDTIRRVLEAL